MPLIGLPTVTVMAMLLCAVRSGRTRALIVAMWAVVAVYLILL